MGDADKTLKIQIDTTANTDAIKSTEKAIGDLGEGTKLFGVHMDTLAEGLHKSEQRMEGVGGQSREMYRIFSELDRLAPGMGEGLRAAFTGPLGAIGLALFTGYELLGLIKDYNKALDAEGAADAKPIFAAVANLKTSWMEATEKFGEYEAAIATAGTRKDTVGDEIASEKGLIDLRIKGINELKEAERKRLEELGASEDEIEQRLKKFTDQIAALQNEHTHSVLEEFKKRNAPMEQATLDEKARVADQAEATAKLKLKNAQDELTAMTPADGTKSPAQTRLDELEEIKKSFENIRDHNSSPSDFLAVAKYAADAALRGGKGEHSNVLEDIAEAQKQLDNEHKLSDQQRAKIESLQEAASEAKTIAEAAEAAGKTNAEQVKKLPGEIKPAERDEIIAQGGAAEDVALRTGRVNAQQLAAINNLNDLATMMGTNMAAIIQMLKTSHALHSTQQTDINNLQSGFAVLAAQMKNAPYQSH